MFLLFACVSFYKGVSGASSCGCFGAVEVNPWITFSLDLGILAASALSRAKETFAESRAAARKNILPVLLLSGAALVSITLTIASGRGASPTNLLVDARQNIKVGSAVVLDAQYWLGKNCPLLTYCSFGRDLKEGRALVMLSRKDCKECARQLPKIEEVAKNRHLELYKIDVGINDDQEILASYHEDGGRVGYLMTKVEWVARTPQVFELEDGVVKDVLIFH